MGEQPAGLTGPTGHRAGDDAAPGRLDASFEQRGGLVAIASSLVGLETNPAAVVFGVITVGAVLAAEGVRNEPYVRSVGAAVAVLVLFWLVHAWSTDTGSRLETRRSFDARAFAQVLREESPIMRGALPPIAAVIMAGFAGMVDRRAVFVGTLVSAATLVVIEFTAATRNCLAPRQVAIQTASGGAFGCALIILHFIVV